MTLLAFYGFDDAVAEPGAGAGGGTTGRGGVGKAMRCFNSARLTNIASFTPASSVVVGFAHRSDQLGGSYPFARLMDSGGNEHLSLWNGGSGSVQLKNSAGTVLATATGVRAVNVWNYFEWKAVIADSGGSVDLRVDGISRLTYSGDTRNAGVGDVALLNGGVTTLNNGENADFDDVYAINLSGAAPYNDFLGDIVVKTILPNNNGDSSGWLGSDGNSTDNYLLVDEVDSTMTDYVGANTSGQTDYYQMADIATTYDVLAIQNLVYAAKSDAGVPPTIAPKSKGILGGVRTDTTITGLTTSGTVYPGAIYTTDPDGNALTAARLNGMQAGIAIP